MSNVQWIKLSTEVFDNRKIRQIEAMPEGDAILVIWFKLLVLAGKTNDFGMVYFTEDIPYTEEMLATEFGKPLNVVRLALNTFLKFGMIEIIDDVLRLSGWKKYQSVDKLEQIRQKNRERQKRYRERQKLSGGQKSQEKLPKLSADVLEDPMVKLFQGYDVTPEQIDVLVDKLKECTQHLRCDDTELDYWRVYDEMSDLITLSKKRRAKHIVPWMESVIATTDFQRTEPDFMRGEA